MTYPEIFYYEESGDEIIYNALYTGSEVADFNRMIYTPLHWKKNQVTPLKKKKTLVLADWSAYCWDDLKIEEVKKTLLELLQNGFTVYIWQTGKALPLTAEMIDCLNKDNQMLQLMSPYDHGKMIAATASQHFLMKEAVHILDDYWLDVIMQKPSSLPERQLNVTNVLNTKLPKTIENICSTLESLTPPVKELINTDFPFADNFDFLAQAKKYLPNATFLHRYKNLQLNLVETKNLLPILLEKGWANTNNGEKIYLKDFAQVEYLDFLLNRDEEVETLYQLIKHLPKLKKLTLTTSLAADLILKNIESKLVSQFISLELKTNKLNDVTVSQNYSNVQSLLLENQNIGESYVLSQQLINLTLKKCSLKSFNKSIDLTKLTNLNLLNCEYTEDNLSFLLSQAPNLKKLSISSLQYKLFAKIPPLSLASLQTLYFVGHNNISSLLFHSLLSGAGDIKELHLEYVTLFEGMESLSLPTLKTLVIDACNFSSRTMTELVNGTKHLETLIIRNEEFPLEINFNVSQRSLEKLELWYALISINELNMLLTEANNFKSLILRDSMLTGEFSNVSSLSKLSLENLHVEGCYCGTEQEQLIGELIKTNVSKLKQLTLIDIVIPNLAISDLSKLESLTLSKCIDFSTTKLENFLIHAKALISLDIRKCKLSGQFANKPILSSLETLTIIDVSMTTEMFIEIIIHAAQLKDLYLEKVQGVDFNDPRIQTLLANVSVRQSADNLKNLPSPIIQEEIVVDQPHDPLSNLTTPSPPDPHAFEFHYTGTNKTKNQEMIIEKVSQYLTLTELPDSIYVCNMQKGICRAMAALFAKKSFKWWQEMLDTLQGWDGKKESLQDITVNQKLKKYSSAIIKQYKKNYVFIHDSAQPIWLGDDFPLWMKAQFSSLKPKQTFILHNPWHEIALKRINNKWYIYDPNFVNGYRRVKKRDLVTQVKTCLGNLIFLRNQEDIIFPISLLNKSPIPHPVPFIREGGLLALLFFPENHRKQLIEYFLQPLLTEKALTAEDIKQGLLMRDVQGTPAWVTGLYKDEHLKNYIQALINKFATLDTNYHLDIAQSIAHLPPLKQQEILTLIYPQPVTLANKNLETSSKENHPLQHKKVAVKKEDAKKSDSVMVALHEAIMQQQQKEAKKNRLAKQFQTWTQATPEYASINEYCKHLLSGCLASGDKQNNWLVTFDNSNDVAKMGVKLQQYCDKVKRPCYYLHSPDDIRCSSSYIQKHLDGTGEIVDGPGGPLHEFLTKTEKPVLIVNYDTFKTEDLVRLNSLLDEHQPKADGTNLPQDTIVIGLMNTKKPDCYQGEDFYSRFGVAGVEICSHALPDICSPPPILAEADANSKDVFSIDFFHAQDWKERLLGRFVMVDGELVFKPGILQTALADGRPINLKNAPWQNKDFTHFWNRARALGFIECEGKRESIKQHHFVQSSGYDWDTLKQNLILDTHLDENAETLNPKFFNLYLERHACNNITHKLNILPGLLAAAKEKGELAVNLTRELSEDEWAILMTECKDQKVKLICHVAPQVKLPNVFNFPIIPKPDFAPENLIPVIVSTDIDVTLSKIATENTEVIDISECNASQLLTSLDGKFIKEEKRFYFTEKTGALKIALAGDKKVILKGKFSAEFIDTLAPLLLKGENKLQLITDDASLFNFMPIVKHEVSIAEKAAIIKQEFASENIDENELKHHSLSELRAKFTYVKLGLPNNDPWQGLQGLSCKIQLDAFHLHDAKLREKNADEFIAKRKEAIATILAQRPFVFLTGLTGVGKSTFIDNYIVNEKTDLYKGETQLEEWAKSRDDGKDKIYFFDEANITARDWSEFEGLFNQPPSIIIKGQSYPLSKHHKVIFAGNPLNYGGGRNMASLFKRHGNALIFEAMSQDFIYEYILKPIFINTPLAAHALNISSEILARYQFICERSTDEVLISPRELQMIALLITANYQPQHDIALLTKHFTNIITRDLLPEQHKKSFDERFPPLETKNTGLHILKMPHEPINVNGINLNRNTDFVVTPSRMTIYRHLLDLLKLRHSRREYVRSIKEGEELNEAKAYGGIGGFVVEGEPGVGKSDLITATLVSEGYQERKLDAKQDSQEKAFYRMPISMSHEDKKKLLLKAFDEGAVVIIDEINSAPMMERLLNDLLMGKGPEGKRPQHPGFTIICTQNPDQMGGRHKKSTALKRRLTTMTLPPYESSELVSIVKRKGMKQEDAKEIVDIYQTQLAYGKKNHLKPLPTFRALLKAVAAEVKNRVKRIPRRKKVDNEKRKFIINDKKLFQNDQVFFVNPIHSKKKKDGIKAKGKKEVILTQLPISPSV